MPFSGNLIAQVSLYPWPGVDNVPTVSQPVFDSNGNIWVAGYMNGGGGTRLAMIANPSWDFTDQGLVASYGASPEAGGPLLAVDSSGETLYIGIYNSDSSNYDFYKYVIATQTFSSIFTDVHFAQSLYNLSGGDYINQMMWDSVLEAIICPGYQSGDLYTFDPATGAVTNIACDFGSLLRAYPTPDYIFTLSGSTGPDTAGPVLRKHRAFAYRSEYVGSGANSYSGGGSSNPSPVAATSLYNTPAAVAGFPDGDFVIAAQEDGLWLVHDGTATNFDTNGVYGPFANMTISADGSTLLSINVRTMNVYT